MVMIFSAARTIGAGEERDRSRLWIGADHRPVSGGGKHGGRRKGWPITFENALAGRGHAAAESAHRSSGGYDPEIAGRGGGADVGDTASAGVAGREAAEEEAAALFGLGLAAVVAVLATFGVLLMRPNPPRAVATASRPAVPQPVTATSTPTASASAAPSRRRHSRVFGILPKGRTSIASPMLGPSS